MKRRRPGRSRRTASPVTVTAALLLAGAAVFFGLPLPWLLLAPARTADDPTTGTPLGFGALGNVDEVWSHLTSYKDAEITLWPGNSVIHDDTATEVVSLARPLWGPAPLATGRGDVPYAELWLRGPASGSDPDHPEYWGEPGDRDQRIVEMAASGFALAFAPKQFNPRRPGTWT
ncbi:DUF2264 domain-containing protein [Streptomyces sp. NPDC096311]|uniref:DUF2264 domain-containing protein n=1 Tax=Streptomyces sp. NPDC096311 TaxID=3366083 RepID=UPI0038309C92